MPGRESRKYVRSDEESPTIISNPDMISEDINKAPRPTPSIYTCGTTPCPPPEQHDYRSTPSSMSEDRALCIDASPSSSSSPTVLLLGQSQLSSSHPTPASGADKAHTQERQSAKYGSMTACSKQKKTTRKRARVRFDIPETPREEAETPDEQNSVRRDSNDSNNSSSSITEKLIEILKRAAAKILDVVGSWCCYISEKCSKVIEPLLTTLRFIYPQLLIIAFVMCVVFGMRWVVGDLS